MMNTTHIVILVSNHEASWYLLVLTMNDFDWTRRIDRRSGRGHGATPKHLPVRLFAPDPHSIPIPWTSMFQQCQHVCR